MAVSRRTLESSYAFSRYAWADITPMHLLPKRSGAMASERTLVSLSVLITPCGWLFSSSSVWNTSVRLEDITRSAIELFTG